MGYHYVRVKILLTNDEWNAVGPLHRFFAVSVGIIVVGLILGFLALLTLVFLRILTLIPVTIYLAVIAICMLLVVRRHRRTRRERD